MSAPPDYYVINYLTAAATALFADTPTNEQLVDLILEGASTETIARVWTDVKAKPPKVLQGYMHERPPDPPIWVVLLKEEPPEEVYAGAHMLSQPEPFVADDGQKYYALGGIERQVVQVQAYADNPETVRFHYLLLRALMYKVSWDLIVGKKVSNAYPIRGADYKPLIELLPAGAALRFFDWAFIYEQRGFVPWLDPPDDADVHHYPDGEG